MSLIKQFSKDALVYGLGKGLKKFIGLLLLLVYTRALSPEQFGILDTLGSALFFVIVFFNFGLDSAVSFFYFKPEEGSEERGKILFTVFVLRLCTIIPALILSFFAWPFSRLIFGSEDYGWAICLNCLLIPVTMLMSEQEMIYRLKRNAWGYNLVTIIKSLVNIGCGLLFVVKLQLGVNGAQLATLLSTLTVVIFSWFTFARRQYLFRFSKEWAKKMIRFGFPLIWAGIAVWIYQLSDRFFLLHYKNPREVGYYSIGSTFAQPIGLINLMFQLSFGVLFYEVFNREESENKGQSKEMMRKILYIYVSAVSLAVVFISGFSMEVVSFITTRDYVPGITAIPFLMVSLMFAQMVEIVPQGISIAQKTWYYTWVTLAAAIVNAGLNFIFIPWLGYVGAAITTLLSTSTYFTLADYFSKRYFDCGFSRLKIYGYCLLTLTVAALFPFLSVYYGIQVHPVARLIGFLVFACMPLVFGLLSFSQIKELKGMLVRKSSAVSSVK